MIPNVTRGGSTYGVLQYLIGPGRGDEHKDQRSIAGPVTEQVFGLEHGAALSNADVSAIAGYLDAPMRAYGRSVKRKLNASGEIDPDGTKRDAHVWHCSLSLRPDEAARSDHEWQRIAGRFMELLGWEADGRHGAGRWHAIHHGVSADGRDHIHVVANVITDDGRQWNATNDFIRAQTACSTIAHEFGLRLVDGQEQSRGQRGYKKGELESDLQRGYDVGDMVDLHDGRRRVSPVTARPENGSRRRLEQIVSSCATAAGDEREFVMLLREHGVVALPRYRPAGAGVEGYKVGFKTSRRGEKLVTYAGGKLARDLSLPALRAGWAPLTEAETLDAWRSPRERTTVPAGPGLLSDAEREIAGLRRELTRIDVSDRRAWACAARDAAGVLNTWSLRTEPTPGPLADAARALRAGSTISGVAGDRDRWRSRRAARAGANALIFHRPARTSIQLAREMSYLTRQIVDMHVLDQQHERAHELEVTALRAMTDLHQRVSAGVVQTPPVPRTASPVQRPDIEPQHDR